MRHGWWIGVAASVSLVVGIEAAERGPNQGAFQLQAPVGLPDVPVPADNPLTADKIELGKKLFFDKRLSKDGSASCETCHVPEKGWTDGLKFSTKVGGEVNTRHTPTLYNVAYYPNLYWDGRAAGLEKQIVAAWKSQMGADPDAIAKKLAEIPVYKKAFEQSMGGPPTGDTVVKAIACFVRTILSGDSPWDLFEHGDEKAISKDAAAGFEVFKDAANCTLCHAPPYITDTLFHNVGIGFDTDKPDLGRGKIVADLAAKENRQLTPDEEKLKGAFKTPGLREISRRSPYMHDGSIATLEEVVDHYDRGGTDRPSRSDLIKPLGLTSQEKSDLVAFLRTLNSDLTPTAVPVLPR